MEPYPSGGKSPKPNTPLTPPPSVQNAIKFMYAGAVVSALEFIIGFATIGSIRNAIISTARQQHRHLTQGQIHAGEVFGVTFLVLTGLLGVALWIWMARANGKGRLWARMVASVLFGLNTLGLLSEVRQPHANLSLVFAVLIWLAGLGAIVLLWQRDSTAFYQASSGPKYS